MRHAGDPGGTARIVAFLARALALGVALFGVLRLSWVETHVLWPFTTAQAKAAAVAGGGPETLARVGLSCSGADAIALCLGFILAWPAGARARIIGMLGGVTVIVAINIVRILTLVRMEASPRFTLAHEYIWPAVLTIASAGYVFTWMWYLQRRAGVRRGAVPAEGPGGEPLVRRFAAVAVVCVIGFFATVPLYLHSAPVLSLATWMAASAAAIMVWLGAFATASGTVLTTAHGGFLVTGECIVTPVIPVGIAAALTLPRTWTGRALGLLAVGPLFVVLGIARLLVLALPPAVVGTPELWVHAFFQVMLALTAVALLVVLRNRAQVTKWGLVCGRAATAAGAGLAVAMLLGLHYTEAVQAAGLNLAGALGGPAGGLTPVTDPQRALALLPPFQVGLFIALTIGAAAGWSARKWVLALGSLMLSQVALFALIQGTVAPGAAIPVPGVRLWSLAAPMLLLLASQRWAREPDGAYLHFWEGVGRDFPDLAGAPSTAYYFANEVRLLSASIVPLEGARILKTDLWDEAKNTRILQWAAGRGARVYGVDIARPTIVQAHAEFGGLQLRAAAADVRTLPFRDSQFDAIYSMGTIEHFDDSDVAVAEMFRVLRPGGRAIIGVPNRLDPFLRPALVRLMQQLGIYGYGAERSFTRGALRRMLEAKGFEVVEETGILFIPGWLRMLDLAVHTWCRPLVPLTRAMVAPFVFLDRRFASLRRHGYLLATVVVKPADR